MPTRHARFPADGIRLLDQLARNNTTEWFHAHKGDYDRLVRQPFIELVEK